MKELCEDIVTFRRDFAEARQKEKESKKAKEERDKKAGEEMRRAAMEGMASMLAYLLKRVCIKNIFNLVL